MKIFNLIIYTLLIFIGLGFFFSKDIFIKPEKKMESSDVSILRMDMMNYMGYTEHNLASSKSKGESILFFAATKWCQSCSALEDEIVDRSREIPENITILKVDYDNDTAMNSKYSVTAQHTLIVLDRDGNEIKRWLGGDFDNMLQELQELKS